MDFSFSISFVVFFRLPGFNPRFRFWSIVTNFFDKGSAADILHWEEIDISGIKFLSDPFRADIASIIISNFFVNVRLSPNGEINLKNIFRNDIVKQAII